ncbi:MAG: DUF883 family protein [Opitutales bacterium]|nr:DUF883 family protein [Opitutales bacterium]
MTTRIKSNMKSVKKSRDQLVEDFKRVIDDFHDLTEESKNASGAAIQRGYDAVQEDIKDGMHAMHDIGGKIAAGAERWKNSAGEKISHNPWRSIAIAAVAGLLLDRFLPHKKR